MVFFSSSVRACGDRGGTGAAEMGAADERGAAGAGGRPSRSGFRRRSQLIAARTNPALASTVLATGGRGLDMARTLPDLRATPNRLRRGGMLFRRVAAWLVAAALVT